MAASFKKSYRANGKLLITGEYLVLSGAHALALPIKYGQTLNIHSQDDVFLHWKASTTEGHWFTVDFDENLNIIKSDQQTLAKTLKSILKTCIKQQCKTVDTIRGKSVQTHLEFNKNWGWGSSSTLISCLSQWLDLEPYLLLQQTFGGSGYDIACAKNNQAIIYSTHNQGAKIQTTNFAPPFNKHIYFVYTGEKQSSKNEIARYKSTHFEAKHIEKINDITSKMLNTMELKTFGNLITEHEQIIGSIIKRNPIQKEKFYDFEGYIKSLGAWGGDFMMVISEKSDAYIQSYFSQHKLDTIFKLNELNLT